MTVSKIYSEATNFYYSYIPMISDLLRRKILAKQIDLRILLNSFANTLVVEKGELHRAASSEPFEWLHEYSTWFADFELEVKDHMVVGVQ